MKGNKGIFDFNNIMLFEGDTGEELIELPKGYKQKYVCKNLRERVFIGNEQAGERNANQDRRGATEIHNKAV